MRTCVVVGCAWVALLMGCEPDCSEGRQGTGGHCCWPGQHWSDEREACQGTPACPQGKVAAGGGCTGPTPKCPDGMVGIGEARFYVGTDKEPRPGGTPPLTEVHTDAFCIDKYEVTVAQYRECVDAGKCAEPSLPSDSFASKECNWALPQHAQHPMNCVDAGYAAKYCKWRAGRLPTQTESQLVALGMARSHFPWGDDPPSAKRGNFAGTERLPPAEARYRAKDPWVSTAPVTRIGGDVSVFGVEGLASNVAEWVVHSPPFRGDQPTMESVTRGGSYMSSAQTTLDLSGTTRSLNAHTPRIGLRCVAAP